MVTTTGSLGASVKPLYGLWRSNVAKKKKGMKASKQPTKGVGVAATQSKANRLESLKKGY